MSDDYLFDGRGAVDPQVAELETLLAGYAHTAPLASVSALPPRRRRWPVLLAGGMALTATAAVLALWLSRDGARPPRALVAGPCVGTAGFAFSVEQGTAACGGGAASTGTLPIGSWLETATDGVANVRVADIGALTVFGDSKLRLVNTGPNEHRLELARGRLSASVLAPPRLFVIDTPAATAVDLGCAYDLEVDLAGRTHLRVTSGAVSLEGTRGVAAYVLAGHEVIVQANRRIGLPVASDTSAGLRAAVTRYDGGDARALADLLLLAEPNDMLTLWNLVGRTAAADRVATVTALERFAQLPADVSRAAILAAEPAALEHWRAQVEARWLAPW